MPTATSSRVYVGNLAWRISWQDLKDHFREAGEPTYAEVFYDYDGRSKGCGVVEFKTVAEAEDAISKLSDTKLGGRPIFVREDRESTSFLLQLRNRGYNSGYGKGYGKGYGWYDDYGYGGYDYDWGKGKGKGKGGKGKSKGYDWDDDYADSGKGKGKGKGKGGKGYASIGYDSWDSWGKGKGKGKGKGEGKGKGKDKGGKVEGKGRNADEAEKSESWGKQVYVGNLSWDVTSDDLKQYFEKAGTVAKAEVNSMRSGRSRGNGTVLFETATAAKKAVAELSDTEFKGRRIYVKEDKYVE